MSKHYGMSYREVMGMPLKTFWCFSKNIDRLLAELDLRLLQVMASAQSAEAYGSLVEKLQKQVGTVVKHSNDYVAHVAQEEKLDRAGLAELRMMGNARS